MSDLFKANKKKPKVKDNQEALTLIREQKQLIADEIVDVLSKKVEQLTLHNDQTQQEEQRGNVEDMYISLDLGNEQKIYIFKKALCDGLTIPRKHLEHFSGGLNIPRKHLEHFNGLTTDIQNSEFQKAYFAKWIDFTNALKRTNLQLLEEVSLRNNDNIAIYESEHFYHVSDILGDSNENYNHLKLSIATNLDRDGGLYGLPLVFVSSSLYSSDDRLHLTRPTISVYPNSGVAGKVYKRYIVKTKLFEEYHSWWEVKVNQTLNNKTSMQVHILMCTNDQAKDLNLENKSECFKKIDRENNPYLRFLHNKWLVNDFRESRVIVNIAVLDEIDKDFTMDNNHPKRLGPKASDNPVHHDGFVKTSGGQYVAFYENMVKQLNKNQ